jgi:hypothetical protein
MKPFVILKFNSNKLVWISFKYSVNREQLEREGFDEVMIATGVVPRA